MPSTSGSSSSQWPTWHVRATARPPESRIWATTSSHASRLRLTTTTSAPQRANAAAIARPRPCVAPVTTATRDDRSKRDQTSLADMSDGSADSSTGAPGVGVDAAARRPWRGALVAACESKAAQAVLADELAREPGGDQDLEVPKHLPDHEQRLLADGALRPQPLGDGVGALRPAEQDRRDARGAPAVLGDPDLDQRPMRAHGAAMAGEQRVERHRGGPPQVPEVLGARPGALGCAHRRDLRVGGDACEQVVADERKTGGGVGE